MRQMRPSSRRLHGDNFIFQQEDNDPNYTALYVCLATRKSRLESY